MDNLPTVEDVVEIVFHFKHRYISWRLRGLVSSKSIGKHNNSVTFQQYNRQLTYQCQKYRQILQN